MSKNAEDEKFFIFEGKKSLKQRLLNGCEDEKTLGLIFIHYTIFRKGFQQ